MANALFMPKDLIEARHVFGIFSHFWEEQSDLYWTDQLSDLGAVTVPDVVGGRWSLAASDATVADNDEIYVASTNEIFLVASGKPAYAEGRFQYTEANTDDANVIFGFMSAAAAAANLMVDDGAGPRTTGNYALIYKIDGGTVWRCRSRNGTDTTDTVSTSTAGGAAFQILGVEIVDLDALNVDVVYTLDGSRLKDSNGYDIVHTMLIASSTEMNVVFGIKNGGATLETLVADYCGGWQAL